MKKMLFAALTLIILSLAASPVLAAQAYIDPNLEVAMSQTPTGETVKVFVTLKEQVDLQAAVADAHKAGGGMARRHYEVITRLQDVADIYQPPIEEMLFNAQVAKQVVSFRSFWIVNAFAIEATPEFIRTLAKQPEIRSIYLDIEIELIEPVGDPVVTDSVGRGVENGVTVSRAPELWALGIDGTGALACDQDTGADGSHPAFADRWRGLDPGVAASAAWFDPLGHETFPSESGWNEHGTHTLGTMVGDDGAGNQIGMAPGAKWIGAKTIDTGGDIFSDAVAAFQWMADPDGNPGTMDDVPDVVNNSWGLHPSYYGHCLDDFNASIDAAEAAGVVVVFAAGNEGPGASSLRSPASRIASDYNVFSIGALEQDGSTIADFSSHGPSDCDYATVKPEVSAVGVDVRSAMPGGGYQTMSGTSMATPHVAGAVLLLRQAFPEATPDEIKMGLYFTAVDLGSAGEDNTFGRGRIDVVEAYYFLLDYFVSSDGKVDLDAEGYTCSSTVTIKVADSDLDTPTIAVQIWSDTETSPETVTLSSPDLDGFYEGTIETDFGTPASDGLLQTSDSDTITVKYIDADDGEGGVNVEKTVTAQADCIAPEFAGLTKAVAGDGQVGLQWKAATDANPVVYNIYRADAPGTEDFDNPIATTAALSYVDETVINMQYYFYVVRAQDMFGMEDENTVEKRALPFGRVKIWEETWEDGWLHEWEIIDGGLGAGTWEDTNPNGRSLEIMNGTFMIADSDYYSAATMDEELISEEIDPGDYEDLALRFANSFKHYSDEIADVDLSFDGGEFENLRHMTGMNINWVSEADLPDVDFSTFRLRFHYYNAKYEWYWAIDDIQIMGYPQSCDVPEDCDDGVFCNGPEECVKGYCVKGIPSCADDHKWCNGTETCDEEAGACIQEYNEENPRCPSDGEFCNGVESCDEENDSCYSPGDPCEEDATCSEATDECLGAGDDDDETPDDDDDDTGTDDDDDDNGGGDDDDDDDDGCGC